MSSAQNFHDTPVSLESCPASIATFRRPAQTNFPLSGAAAAVGDPGDVERRRACYTRAVLWPPMQNGEFSLARLWSRCALRALPIAGRRGSMAGLAALGLMPAVPSCAGLAARPAPTAPAPPAAVARVSITGMIVNGVTSRPLKGAILDLDDHPGRSESGLDGRFRIDDVPIGPHLLTARAQRFRSRTQPVKIVAADPASDPESGPRNDFIVFLFAPSGYFDSFPRLGAAPPCRNEADCPANQICLMNNFREMDAPSCTLPAICKTEADCRLGQQCEPITLLSNEELRVCQGQPAPEVEP